MQLNNKSIKIACYVVEYIIEKKQGGFTLWNIEFLGKLA
jgi:hypothetical protein